MKLEELKKVCEMKFFNKSSKSIKESPQIEEIKASLHWISNANFFVWSNKEHFKNREIREWFIRKRFYEMLGYFPNLKTPKTFNEKLNWLKLNYFNPLELRCEDKIEFKKYIKETLGDGYTIPLIKEFESIDDINFEELPDSFVIKNTESGGSTGVKVIRNKYLINQDLLKYELNQLSHPWCSNYYAWLMPNRDKIKQRLFAEEYIEEIDKFAADFKFFCFDGKVEFFYLANNFASTKHKKLSYYDMKLKRLDINYDGYEIANVEETYHFNKMVEIASKLSKGFPIVRIDFYDTKDKFYIGEMTFYPGGGVGKYNPSNWDLEFGKLINLENLNKEFLV